MLDIPLNVYMDKSIPGNKIMENQSREVGETEYKDSISLTDMNEIKWITDMLEPFQQRGPSENP